MIKYLILLLLGFLVSCNSNHIEYGDSQFLEEIKSVNMSDFNGNPADFDNDTVRLSGELHLDLENKGFLVNSQKVWIESFRPATVLDSAWNKVNGKQVEIIGLYQSGKAGHLGLYNGLFKEVYYIRTK